MLIWNSILVMTVFDLVIIGSVSYLYVLFYQYRKITSFLQLRTSMTKILLGLSIIQLFYVLDLFSMWILPRFISMEKAMEFMTALHLNWRWITSLVGIILIFFGLSTMFPKIYLNFQRIRNICEELDLKNRDLEFTLDKLKQTQLQLVQNEKMSTLGNLIAGVAHEINNPLSFLGGNINLAEEHLQDLLYALNLYQQECPILQPEIADEMEDLDIDFVSKDFPKMINSMRYGVDSIGNMSKSLRVFSRTDTYTKTKFNLHEGIDSTLLILKYRLKANEQRPGIQIIKNYGDIPEIQCYPGQLNQVFMNLIANAIDALEEAREGFSFPEIEANPQQIYIKTERKGEAGIVRISDNGKGMSEEVKTRIFEQGFTTKGVGKGTGLGMAISKQIVVEKHGGKITCTSEEGKGTEFVINLPIF